MQTEMKLDMTETKQDSDTIPQTETHNNRPQQNKSLLLKLSFMGLTPKIPQWEVSETDWPQNPANHREPWAVFSSWRKTFDSTGPWSFSRRNSPVGQREDAPWILCSYDSYYVTYVSVESLHLSQKETTAKLSFFSPQVLH